MSDKTKSTGGATVVVNDTTICHQTSGGVATSTLPDICLNPASVPIPFTNVSYSTDLIDGTKTIFADGGSMCAIEGSRFQCSIGDEAGSSGGILSGTHLDQAEWLTYSSDVCLEGLPVCRRGDKMLMNDGNTADLAGLEQPDKAPDKEECASLTPEKTLELLKPGDIILSTTSERTSAAIRFLDGGTYSHSYMYTGDGKIVEMLGDGAQEHTLDVALSDDSLARVVRVPSLTADEASAAVDYMNEQVAAGTKYDIVGLLGAHPVGAGFATLAGKFNDKLFCSEAIYNAFEEAKHPIGEPLIGRLPLNSTPASLEKDLKDGNLECIGPLKGGPAAKTSKRAKKRRS